ncbi:TetR/AcrR family transcriptional regulator [Halorhodospira halochloris]|uniref:TetR/AcrR family transcriptional regulator n=1 Tax=Halorhodospira halochloris TaxID=1052 RepID=UPI001EE7FBB2|nr:TetR/AcrR family transcriptional regulator [Halorhodospira halochloris]MCG5530468.1 TetR/AcrR family transcriptional regulator [Halorhodospira halochloris]
MTTYDAPPPSGSGPVTERGERTRRKLIGAAEAELGEKGFHKASISSITQRAGIAQGTFYLYYRSKEEIFRALVEHMNRTMRRHLSEAIDGARDRLEAERLGLEAFLSFCREHGHLYRIVMEAQFVDPEAHQYFFRSLADSYAERLRQAQQRNEVSDGDPHAQALALIGIAFFMGQRHWIWDQPPTDEDALATATAIIEKGLAPPPTRGGK